jgi:CRP-like cAMP-binding protein
MAEIFSALTYKQGSGIFSEGDPSHHFFVIRQGKVAIRQVSKNLENRADSSLVAGDFFGVEAALSSHPHFYHAVAETDCVLAAIRRDQYELLFQNNTAIVMKIATHLSLRLRFLNTLLTAVPATFSAQAEKDLSNGTRLYTVGDFFGNNKMYNHAYYAWYQYLRYFPQGAYAALAKTDVEKIKDKVTIPPVDYAEEDSVRKYPQGTIICMEGEPSVQLYIVQKGIAKITKVVNDKEKLIAMAGAGDFLGEMAMLESRNRTATIVAVDNCEVMALNRSKLENLIASQPQVIQRLTEQLCDRVWFTHKQIITRLIGDGVTRCCDMLSVYLEKQQVHLNTAPHVFTFSLETLCEMCGITDKAEAKAVIGRLTREDVVIETDNKIVVKNKLELTRRVKLYWAMHPLK